MGGWGGLTCSDVGQPPPKAATQKFPEAGGLSFPGAEPLKWESVASADSQCPSQVLPGVKMEASLNVVVERTQTAPGLC